MVDRPSPPFSITDKPPLIVIPNSISLTIPNTTREICQNFPPFVTSKGIWPESHHDHRNRWWLNNSLSLLQLQIILIFSAFGLVHFVLKRFGVSRITSQVIGGIILGVSLKLFEMKGIHILTEDSETILGLLGYFGFLLYMFVTAVKIDVTLPTKAGRKSVMIALPFVFVPMIGGIVVQSFFNTILTNEEEKMTRLLVCYHSLTSLSVVFSVISEVDILNSDLSRLCLSSTMVSEMISLVALLIIGFVVRYQNSHYGPTIIFIIVVVFVFRPAMKWIVRQTPEGKAVKSVYVQGITLLALISFCICTLFNRSAILGTYLLGLLIPHGAPLGSSLEKTLECFVLDVFIPIFSVFSAIRVDLRMMFISLENTFTKVNIFLFFLVLSFKMIACFISSIYCNLPYKDSLAVSLLMSCKGIVEIALYSLFRYRKIIPDDGLLGWFILSATLVATVVPISVRKLYGPNKEITSHENRNIMYLKSDSELRVIACIHHNENIPSIIHLLNISCPTAKNPLAVYAIHLIELIGRTTPIFIHHSLQKKVSKDESFSQNIILSLDHFARDNHENVSVEYFTSISPFKYMSDDLTKLALDKMTSLMIVPFHRTWTPEGFINQDDNMIKALNCNMLDTTPCSLGIFVNRGHLGYAASKSSTDLLCKYTVCVLFLGGNDDREALSFAKRMVNEPRVELTVLRLMSAVGNGSSKWEEMLDSEVIRDFRLKCEENGTNETYIEQTSEDGPQTALKLREMANDYDLMIVGRRSELESAQTSGLSEWIEFPELGILGDLIVSFDINYKASVLVIQQQKITQSSSF